MRVGVGVIELFQCVRCEEAFCIFQLLDCWLEFSDYVGDCVSVFVYLLLYYNSEEGCHCVLCKGCVVDL